MNAVERGKLWRQANPERVKQNNKRWRKQNPQRAKYLNRRFVLKTQYGLSIEQFESLNASQDGCCKICGRSPYGENKFLSVDHDHESGKVRGLLCRNCNTMIGGAEDKVETLRKGIEYLNQFNQQHLAA